jgi:hypothetical protein
MRKTVSMLLALLSLAAVVHAAPLTLVFPVPGVV